MVRSRAYPAIGDYALIGDCHTAALVARDGSIDWYCPRRFDAPAVFCRMLDVRKGGFFSTLPVGDFSAQRRYVGSTNVLETTLSCPHGSVRLTDLMPIHRRTREHRGYDVGSSGRLLRLVECVSGEVELEVTFKPTFDYARAATELALVPDRGAIAHAGTQYLTVAYPKANLRGEGANTARGQFRLRAGDRAWFVLTSAEDPDRASEALSPVNCEQQLARTLEYWHDWAARCTYEGQYRDLVLRSALVLKLLTYEPSGAVVAAPTTSLPEHIGGPRNWDYRFTWLRDASLILYALITVGYGDEAADFIDWMERTVGADPTREPQIMYGIDGRRELPEHLLDALEGYGQSTPVRIGNAAAGQRQLDIYGEVLRAAELHYQGQRDAPQPEAWEVLRGLVQRAADTWTEAGHGIWEVRGGPRQFTYGKLMCWAALDIGVRLAHKHGLAAPVARWRRERDRVRSAILEHAFNSEVGAFMQSFDSPDLDASALIIPRIGFLPATDPRVRSTIARIQHDLTRHGLVYRYRTPDGFAGGEGTFTLCSFWLADALALSGSLDQAYALFEHVAGYANDLGLLAEEINPTSREQLGNFPQGFSHLALIGAAVDLAKGTEQGAEEQPEHEAGRAHRAARVGATRHAPAEGSAGRGCNATPR
jgi:GH15 family glucan-1,4-alpha-glucosidase